jgi:hypothetical protein
MIPQEDEKDGGFGLGLALALVGGLALAAVADHAGSYGWAFVVGIPATMGFVLGYNSGAGRALRIFGVIFLVAGVVAGAITLHIAGVLCGVVAACIMLLPTAAGVVLGGTARRRKGRPPAVATSIVLLVSCGALLAGEPRLEPLPDVEEVTTRRVVGMAPERAWQALVFYEEVDFEPPLLARIGLPHPLRTEGRVTAVGDVKRCVYSTGHLRKRITAFEPGRRLAFDVIEQQGIEDRSVELVRGSFRFEPLGDGRTEVVLSTVYRPLLSARPAWRPFERRLARVLHDHVLDGMESEHRRARVLLARASH